MTTWLIGWLVRDLVVGKDGDQAECAYCGTEKRFDRPCPKCGSWHNKPETVRATRPTVEASGVILGRLALLGLVVFLVLASFVVLNGAGSYALAGNWHDAGREVAYVGVYAFVAAFLVGRYVLR